MKKKIISILTVAMLLVPTVAAKAETKYFGATIPATGSQGIGGAYKDTADTYFTLSVSSTSNNNNYRFWGVKTSDPNNRQTTESSASGTGTKYAYYATSTQAKDLKGEYMRLVAKTGPLVYTSMFLEGSYTP